MQGKADGKSGKEKTERAVCCRRNDQAVLPEKPSERKKAEAADMS